MPPPKKENPLHNFLINVILPVVALSVLGKEGGKPWHIGPGPGMALAVLMPLSYGIWFFVRHRQANAFSIIGLVSVLLTGGITLLVWRDDGTIHENAAFLFALKEASIPLILGITVIISHFTPTPLIRLFLFNPDIFDIPRIEKAVEAKSRAGEFRAMMWHASLAFGGAFLVSTVLNFFLSMHFLGAVDTAAADAKEAYNSAVARQTFWGFIVIGLPVFVILLTLMLWLLKRLGQITGLDRDDLLVPR